MLPICPCKNCNFETGRYVGCHANCNKYIEWKKLKDGYNRIEKLKKIK